MKKILLGLSLIFILGCSDRTDKNGFYITGENKGIHKETKTKYDKEGYDCYGFNKDKINKYTGTNYDIDGWDISGFNEKGINKTTGFNFNEKGNTQEIFSYPVDIFTHEMVKKPYFLDSFSGGEKEYFKTDDDKFEGITYVGKSYSYDLINVAITTKLAKTSMELAEKRKLESDYKVAYENINKALEIIKNKFYIDIITNYSPSKEVESYFIFTFFSPQKEHDLKSVELLVNGNIIKIDNYLLYSNNIEINYTLLTEKLPMYLNQVKIPVTDNLFNLFAKMEKDKKIEVRILTDIDNRFTWINKIEKDKGLPIGLGRHYKLKNSKDVAREIVIF
ncbi:hypothetical protein [Fusobacterium perfoetens]|uniref:hypothetical protein n=1 Tax=Fusobacterium perfoetens TaxID=852 RepID=UPI0006877523|nr:hypothetical protein [Fusobacterium perfoetens]